ncbi:hypothetical protein E4656_06155 [Natronospirillum operosum]|uniref:Flagellar assembly protein FliH n=1 Tax=Natronospirillum operosum TaxID=2759953 RepID=A0A4Z0WJK3_9GAMM|nr:FliH/SctL family protein [Natronospirillum operosum]TGG95977.1 hypothetical protein E4656_06155 [Natronospirillum operosum]
MAVNQKGFTEAEKLNVRSWQLPDLEGPRVHEEDALGNRALREAAMRQRGNPLAGAADDEAATGAEAEDEVVPAPPSAAELQAIREAAREEGLEEGRQAGYQAGFEEGRTAGYQEGHAEGLDAGEAAGREQAEIDARAALDAHLQALSQRFGQAIQALNEHEQALEQELAPVARDLILKLTQGLVVQSLQQNSEQIEDIVHQAVQLMPAAHERMRIFLHPEDCSMLKGLQLHWLEQVDLQPDDSLSPGGCLIKTHHSLLDYSLDQRYQRQIMALLDLNNGFSKAAEPPEALRSLSADRFSALLDESAAATASQRQTAAPEAEVDDLEEEDAEGSASRAEGSDPDAEGSDPDAEGSDPVIDEDAAPGDDDEPTG